MRCLVFLCALVFSVATDVDLAEIRSVLQASVDARAFPGASFAVVTRDSTLTDAIGRHMYDTSLLPVNPPVDARETLFDLASLSKVVATTSAAAKLFQESFLPLNATVVSFLGAAFGSAGKADITIAHLLTHSAGFAADPTPNFWAHEFGCPDSGASPRELSTACRSQIYAALLAQPLISAVGTTYVYSDLSFLTLAYVIGAVVRSNALVPPADLRSDCAQSSNDADSLMCFFEAYVRQRVFSALGMRNTMFVPPPNVRAACAPAEDQRVGFARGVIQGWVSDGNAFALGGIAGHAGVFSTAIDMAKWARSWLVPEESGFYSAATVALFSQEWNRSLSSRALGWNTNDPLVADFGTFAACGNLSALTFMHTGYTGTQVCVDPALGVATVLLTNRVFPTDATGSTAIQSARRAFNNLIYAATQAPSPSPEPVAPQNVTVLRIIFYVVCFVCFIGGSVCGFRWWQRFTQREAQSEYHSMAAQDLTRDLN